MTVETEPRPLADLEETFKNLRKVFEAVGKWVETNFSSLLPLARQLQLHLIFEEAGWIPHYTTPFDQIGMDPDAVGLSMLLDGHYRRNWTQVRRQFEERLRDLAVDEEAKAVFVEALDAHGHGLYRTTARLLFPEIERVARIELLDGRLSRMASLEELRTAVGDLGLSEMAPPGGGPVFAQYSCMHRHLYETVKTAQRVAEVERDPVPNRHAVVHGLVVYKTMQSSINALVMTEFMFQVIPAMKSNLSKTDSSIVE